MINSNNSGICPFIKDLFTNIVKTRAKRSKSDEDFFNYYDNESGMTINNNYINTTSASGRRY